MFGDRENFSWPLNFYNPYLVNDAWREEKKARKRIKLIRLDDKRKVTIFKAVVGKKSRVLFPHKYCRGKFDFLCSFTGFPKDNFSQARDRDSMLLGNKLRY